MKEERERENTGSPDPHWALPASEQGYWVRV